VHVAGQRGVWTRRRVGDARARIPRRPRGMILVKGSSSRRPLLPDPARPRAGPAARAPRTCATSCIHRADLALRGGPRFAHLIHPHPFYEPMLTIDRWPRLRRSADEPAARAGSGTGTRVVRPRALAARPAPLHRAPHAAPADLARRRDVFYRCAATARGRCRSRARDVRGSSRGAAPGSPPSTTFIPHVYRIGYIEGGDSPVGTSSPGSRPTCSRTPVAAVPSLHAAYATLVLLSRTPGAGRIAGLIAAPYTARDVVTSCTWATITWRHRDRPGVCRGRWVFVRDCCAGHRCARCWGRSRPRSRPGRAAQRCSTLVS